MPSPLKRKVRSELKLRTKARKKPKTESGSLAVVDALPWRTLSHAGVFGNAYDDGILELEEVDNVQVVYDETSGGRVATFKILDAPQITTSSRLPEDGETADVPEVPDVPCEDVEEVVPRNRSTGGLLPEWDAFGLHDQLIHALSNQSFTNPTPIQLKALPLALQRRDVVGVAETGSGKTLAYGLPILHKLLSRRKNPESKTRRPVRALILAPTRELALQISSHLNACLNGIRTAEERSTSKDPNMPNPPPPVSVAAIVGGMSPHKQKRILSRGVDVLVATPGRLWDIMQEEGELANDITSLDFLVLDEADRMIEAGHFAELDNILRLTLRQYCEDQHDPVLEDGPVVDSANDSLQTFVFSATLSKDLQRNLRKRAKPKKSGKGSGPLTTLEDLLERLDFRDPEPEVIDLSPEGGVVSSLQESQVECLSADKDTYLYYFLLRYPGRSLVFLSSIDGIRRLAPLLELLELKTYPLHSQLEQKQRLKNLERFKSTPGSVLLATDIAARGLDIPYVDHVIHYQIPRSADTYVHRNGRTARAMRQGFSLIMCAPDERKVLRGLLTNLGREDGEIPQMNIELYILDKLKARVQLARQIDVAQHKANKAKHEKNWLKETADAMEIELDSDFSISDAEATPNGPTKRQQKAASAKNKGQRLQLKQLLAQPLLAQGVSKRYITSGSNPLVHELLAGESHETMLGVKKTSAGSDLLKKRGKKYSKEEYEEWSGFGSTP
ncbi:ATP-dependent RNA helicase [Thelephora terrestris]|uniref:RNA helicase n=1 Tax=Thelephora terrestris TaxID=56493 RepID=A0A9P6HJC4_9AGAM|nr:ATP-dependent RNA helicase [Thelephora terrestris]